MAAKCANAYEKACCVPEMPNGAATRPRSVVCFCQTWANSGGSVDRLQPTRGDKHCARTQPTLLWQLANGRAEPV